VPPSPGVRINPGTHANLVVLKRNLSAAYERDFTISSVIDALVNSYKPGNERLASTIKEIISRLPERKPS
jgi:hypothetical protein